jgi:hypothetical protein
MESQMAFDADKPPVLSPPRSVEEALADIDRQMAGRLPKSWVPKDWTTASHGFQSDPWCGPFHSWDREEAEGGQP